MSRRFALGGFSRVFATLSPHLRPYRRTLAGAAGCVVGVTAMELLKPWPLKFVFDVLLVAEAPDSGGLEAWLYGQGPVGGVLWVAAAILVFAVLAGLFGYGLSYLTASVGQKVVADIRARVYAHIQRLSHSYHDETSTGDLLARMTGDIRMMRDLLVDAAIFMGDRILVVVGMLTVMAIMDWRLTGVALVIAPALYLLVGRYSGRIKGATRKQRRKESKISHAMTEKLSAISLVQTFAREAHEDAAFAKVNAKSTAAGLVTTRLEANLNRIVQVLLAAGTAAVLAYGVMRVRAGALTPGDLLVFSAYLAGLYKPVRKLSSLTSRLAKATACGERLVAILDTRPEISDRPGAVVADGIRGEVVLDGVTFGYGGDSVLQNAELRIEPGEKVALVGSSGAGKSTIAKLLLRFYDPVAGRVLLDGRDVRDYTLDSLRSQFAVVPQESILFNTSIAKNIGYGRLDASDDEIENAARAANAHDFIAALPDGYRSVVSERGASLSGGQRQRIAIARALVRNAPVVILDEPLTGLDRHNRHAVERALDRLIAGRTCLVITHDAEAARFADRIVQVVDGRAVEMPRSDFDRMAAAG